jgi:DNA-binding PucR family transcriptional regulator
VGEFFSALFADRSEDTLKARAAAAALAPASHYQAVSVSVHQGEAGGGESFWHELSHRCRAFEDQGCVWTAFAGIASVIIPLDGQNDVLEIAGQLERFAQEAGGKRVIVTVGGRQAGVTGIKATLEEANGMLAVSRHRGLEGVIRPLDVVVPALLAASPRLANELVVMLEPLIEEDRRGRAALLQTLHTYVACSLSVHRTAEQLFVHRNTVRSRLRRIEELLGTRIADVKLPIELALVAHEMRLAEAGV